MQIGNVIKQINQQKKETRTIRKVEKKAWKSYNDSEKGIETAGLAFGVGSRQIELAKEFRDDMAHELYLLIRRREAAPSIRKIIFETPLVEFSKELKSKTWDASYNDRDLAKALKYAKLNMAVHNARMPLNRKGDAEFSLRIDKHIRYLEIADISLRMGKYEDAISACKNAIKMLPNNSDAYEKLGDIEVKRKNPDQAGAYYLEGKRIAEKRVEKNIGNYRASSMFANVMIATDEVLDFARMCGKKAAVMLGDKYYTWKNEIRNIGPRLDYYSAIGQYDEAVTALNRVVEVLLNVKPKADDELKINLRNLKNVTQALATAIQARADCKLALATAKDYEGKDVVEAKFKCVKYQQAKQDYERALKLATNEKDVSHLKSQIAECENKLAPGAVELRTLPAEFYALSA